MQQGTTCSREVASLPKTSSCKEKSDSVSSNLSSCSVSDLAQLTNQYRATGRIRRESRGQLGGGLGQSSIQVLTNSLKKKLNKLDLIPPEDSRDSVICYTPSRQPPTSTPSNSPPPPPLPPRSCQSLGPQSHTGGNHNSACTEISAIELGSEEVFYENNLNQLSQLPLYVHAPGTLIPVKETKDTMEADENDAKLKIRKLAEKMGSYESSQLTMDTLPYYKPRMDEVGNLYEEIILGVGIHVF